MPRIKTPLLIFVLAVAFTGELPRRLLLLVLP
jgi:hypothetical protein